MTAPLTTPSEAFALDAQSCFYNAVNGHIGILNCLLSRDTLKGLQDEVHGDVEKLLCRLITRLNMSRERLHSDVIEYIGGEDRYRALQQEWITSDLSHAHTWRQGRASDAGGKPITGE